MQIKVGYKDKSNLVQIPVLCSRKKTKTTKLFQNPVLAVSRMHIHTQCISKLLAGFTQYDSIN